jgi:cytochrome c6
MPRRLAAGSFTIISERRTQMRKMAGAMAIVIGVCVFVVNGSADETPKRSAGEAAFNEYCLVCHPGGGNIFNPVKTLHKKDMEANNIKTPEDIINIMRNPGPLMTKFDEFAVPARVAEEIAEFIMKNFK